MMEETGKNWDTLLPNILNAYRARPGDDGVYPFEIMFGVPPSGFARYITTKFNRYVDLNEGGANQDDQNAINRRAVHTLVVNAQRLSRVAPITAVTYREFDVRERVFYQFLAAVPLHPCNYNGWSVYSDQSPRSSLLANGRTRKELQGGHLSKSFETIL